MAVTGERLAADIARLLALGQSDLPQLAFIYARLNRDVAGTASDDVHAFGAGSALTGGGMAGAHGGGGSLGALYQAWSGLRDQLQDALAGAATALVEAGRAVVAIANDYADTDGASAADIRAVEQELLSEIDYGELLPTTPGPVTTSQHEG